LRPSFIIAAALAAFASPALAQDAYVVGITAALTGPPASTYAPAIEALRIYLDRVNAAGGVNGKKINLIIQDDSAEPSKAAANAKKLLTQDNAVLMINASLSSTYAPTINEALGGNEYQWIIIRFAVVPKGTPADRKAYLGAAVQAAMKDPELIAEYQKAGVYFDPKLTDASRMEANLKDYAEREREFYVKTGRLK